MKNLIFTLGTFCLTVVNVANAGNPDPIKEMTTKYYNNVETIIMFPDDVLSAKLKTASERIAMDNQIIGQSATVNELTAAKKSIEQIIIENNQIIESNIQDVVYTINLK